ncbi:MAG: hypothetical protein UZ07_CHB004000801 [Chlorobi bacterium OLB7]|nr:MAG: hypothetical protein UZ07_CHB004000801 [Chlorobi bacterium OLB7]
MVSFNGFIAIYFVARYSLFLTNNMDILLVMNLLIIHLIIICSE